MAECDPQTLLGDASCFSCLTEKQLNTIIAQLLCDIANGGAPCFCENLAGADSPLNVITPDFVGQVYVQNDSAVWQAGSLLSSSWELVCEPIPAGGNGMVWGPNLTELDFFIWQNGTFPDGQSFSTQPITSLSFPALERVTDDAFDFSGDPELVSVSAPNLVFVYSLLGYSCSNLTSVDFLSLVEVDQGDMDLSSDTGLTSLTFPSLERVTNGTLFVENCTALTSLLLPIYEGGTLGCSNCALTTLVLPVFNAELSCSQNQLTTLSLPACVNGSISCEDNLLTSISLPLYECGGNNFVCSNNQLTTLNLPTFADFSNFFANDNQLTHINAPNMNGVFSAGTIDVSNNALDTATVEFLLHVAVLAGYGAGATVALDGGTNAGLASLSAQGQADFATLFGNGVAVTTNP